MRTDSWVRSCASVVAWLATAALASAADDAPDHSVSVGTSATLNVSGARRVLAAAVADAMQKSGTSAIAVVDSGGNLLCLERLDGTFLAAAQIAIGKARTAAMFKKPTKFFEDVIGKGRTSMVTLPDFTPLQGGVPIVVDSEVVGAIGVSGAASAQQDEEVALAGAASLAPGAGGKCEPAQVSFFDSNRVSAAFAKGDVLFARDSVNYAVHASRRVAPGVPEVHERETDIIYVLEGSATLVTGGSVTEAKTTAPNEIRGQSIDGGESRQIARGDVVIVPRGVAHWFQTVDAPVLYYVVKVQ